MVLKCEQYNCPHCGWRLRLPLSTNDVENLKKWSNRLLRPRSKRPKASGDRHLVESSMDDKPPERPKLGDKRVREIPDEAEDRPPPPPQLIRTNDRPQTARQPYEEAVVKDGNGVTATVHRDAEENHAGAAENKKNIQHPPRVDKEVGFKQKKSQPQAAVEVLKGTSQDVRKQNMPACKADGSTQVNNGGANLDSEKAMNEWAKFYQAIMSQWTRQHALPTLWNNNIQTLNMGSIPAKDAQATAIWSKVNNQLVSGLSTNQINSVFLAYLQRMMQIRYPSATIDQIQQHVLMMQQLMQGRLHAYQQGQLQNYTQAQLQTSLQGQEIQIQGRTHKQAGAQQGTPQATVQQSPENNASQAVAGAQLRTEENARRDVDVTDVNREVEEVPKHVEAETARISNPQVSIPLPERISKVEEPSNKADEKPLEEDASRNELAETVDILVQESTELDKGKRTLEMVEALRNKAHRRLDAMEALEIVLQQVAEDGMEGIEGGKVVELDGVSLRYHGAPKHLYTNASYSGSRMYLQDILIDERLDWASACRMLHNHLQNSSTGPAPSTAQMCSDVEKGEQLHLKQKAARKIVDHHSDSDSVIVLVSQADEEVEGKQQIGQQSESASSGFCIDLTGDSDGEGQTSPTKEQARSTAKDLAEKLKSGFYLVEHGPWGKGTTETQKGLLLILRGTSDTGTPTFQCFNPGSRQGYTCDGSQIMESLSLCSPVAIDSDSESLWEKNFEDLKRNPLGIVHILHGDLIDNWVPLKKAIAACGLLEKVGGPKLRAVSLTASEGPSARLVGLLVPSGIVGELVEAFNSVP